ncbi:MAG: hypothetical protein K8R28_06855 [Desulfobacterales bacterium]|nr:hypothetical protein [Desulfobacterales bacterium]
MAVNCTDMFCVFYSFSDSLKPKLSDFLLDLHQSLAHQGLAKSLDISIGMPTLFANLAASRSQHISSQKIAQLRLKPG